MCDPIEIPDMVRDPPPDNVGRSSVDPTPVTPAEGPERDGPIPAWHGGRDWLAARATLSPDRIALLDAGDGSTFTYEALDEAVDRTASRLAAAGVESGAHLGILSENRPAFVRLVHAALRLGVTAVPLNRRLTPGELTAQIDRADLDVLVCTADTVDAATAAAADDDVSVPILPIDPIPSTDATATGVSPEPPLCELDPDPVDPTPVDADTRWLIVFTSGTTGTAKPVVLTEWNLRASALASAFRLGLNPDDRWLVPLPAYHMGGIAPFLRATVYGTAAILQRTFDPEETLAAVDRYDSTGMSIVPTALSRLLDTGELPDLRFVLCGGASTPPELIERCAARDVPICPTYGTTETASQIATARPGTASDHPESVGRPLLWTRVSVVDDDGEPLKVGKTGELVVSGPTVSPGYYGMEEATEAARGTFGLHTGDLGYRDEDGRLYVLGRRDDTIVTGGENVPAAEVERVLREHESIDDAAVLGLDDDEWGERVAALVVGDLSPTDVARHCDGRLAGYKRPRTIAIVGELPRTASGTVDRSAARELLEDFGVEV